MIMQQKHTYNSIDISKSRMTISMMSNNSYTDIYIALPKKLK